MDPYIDLSAILHRYSCLAPPSVLPNVPRQKLQDFLINSIINNDLLAVYPPSPQYQRSFWKRVITQLETNYDEDEDFELSSEIYDRYLRLLESSPSAHIGDGIPLRGKEHCRSFATYHWKPPVSPGLGIGQNPCLTTTLIESRNIIERGTTGLRTWTAAFVLTQYILNNPDLILRKRILELGSGVGFMGTVISSLQVLSRVQDDTLPKLWLTDVDETVLSTCRSNVDLPCNLSSLHGNVGTRRLDWSEALDTETAPGLSSLLRKEIDPDLIVGSDLVFDPDLIQPLLSTVKIALEGSNKIALFALTVRNETTISMFLSSAQDQGLQVEEIFVTGNSMEFILPTGIVDDIDTVKLLKLSAKS